MLARWREMDDPADRRASSRWSTSASARICGKLLDEAKTAGKALGRQRYGLGQTSRERSAVIADVKVEAPERVQPTGDVTIAEVVETE